MPTKEEIELLQSELYATYLAAGWNLKKRSISVLTNLLHSEVSEAMEGNRKNLMDDKLPHYKMEVVEVADFAIRAFNWMTELGYTTVNMHSEAEVSWYLEHVVGTYLKDMDMSDYLAELHDYTSYNRSTMLHPNIPDDDVYSAKDGFWLWRGVSLAFFLADKEGWDLMAVMREKNTFNATRPDHTLEERAKEHGKQY